MSKNGTITISIDDIIGGDITDIRDEIKERALSGFANEVNRKLQSDFLEELMSIARTAAEVKISGFVEEFLAKPITLTRRYGEPERTATAKELIMEAWQKSLWEKVNDRLEPSGYSGAKPRLQQVAENLMRTEIKAASDDIRKQLSQLVDSAFRQSVTTGILSAIGINLNGAKK